MKPSIKPLGISQKVSLRIDDTGLICFQFMIKTEDGHNCYIDFFVGQLIKSPAIQSFKTLNVFSSAQRTSTWRKTFKGYIK